MASITDALQRLKDDPRGPIDPAVSEMVCRELGLEWRNTPLSPPNTLALLLQQVLAGNVSNPELLRNAGLELTPAAYCTAKGRLPMEAVQEISRRVCAAAAQCADRQGQDLWIGHRTWHEDGSTFSMPDTPELREHFGLAPSQRKGCGFPVAHTLGLFSAHTGLIRDVVLAPWRTHDLAGTPMLLKHLEPGDIQIGDTAFSSYFHLAGLLQRGAHAIFPAHQKRIVNFRQHRPFRRPGTRVEQLGLPTSRWVKRLGKYDQIVEYFKPPRCPDWMSPQEYEAAPASILVREIRRKVWRGRRKIVVTISTTLLDPVKYPADEIVKLLGKRWNVEINLRHLKTTMGMEVLRCQSVEGVQKELWAFVLVYNLVRVIMMEASARQQVALDRISFADALYWMRHARPGDSLPDLMVNPYRPDRVEPRAIKRRPKPYDLLVRPRSEMRKARWRRR